jgi:transposase-like protein
MSRLANKLAFMQALQECYQEIRSEFGKPENGGRYSDRQKEYALRLIGEYGVRATARILQIPRRTLQRWCRVKGRRVQRCPAWVYDWAKRRRKRREFWSRRGYG